MSAALFTDHHPAGGLAWFGVRSMPLRGGEAAAAGVGALETDVG